MSNVKKQNTLFRFVSLRSPELSKKEDQKDRFIIPEKKTGIFYDSIKNLPDSASRQTALNKAAQEYSAFTQETDIETFCGKEFYSIAQWISQNKFNLSLEETLKKIEKLKELDFFAENNLWDQLFYQIITPSSLYVKEGIIHVLTLQNLLKRKKEINDINEFSSKLSFLAQAKIVIPKDLFEREKANQKSEKVQQPDPIITEELIAAQHKEEARSKIEMYQNFLSLLEKETEKIQEEYEESYSQAQKKHQKTIDPLVDKYQKQYTEEAKRLNKLALDEGKDPNALFYQPNIEKPELPEFSFKPLGNILSLLTDLLPDNDLKNYLTSLIEKYKIEDIKEVFQFLKKEIEKEYRTITNYTQTSRPVSVIGNTAITANRKLVNLDTIPFRYNTNLGSNQSIYFIHMYIMLPNSSFLFSDVSYTITSKAAINNIQKFVYNYLEDQTILHLLFYTNNTQNISQQISGTVDFENGSQYNFEFETIFGDSYNGYLNKSNSSEENELGEIPSGFGITQLGIADYKKVVSEVICYDPGEVSHIENIMAREYKERSTKKFHQTQTSVTESSETETEKLFDTTSTERFEMQSEIAKIIQEQRNASINTNAHYGGKSIGGFSMDIGAGYATANSKEESNRQALTEAKELTQQAMERIVSKVKKETSTKITDEFTEENKHGFDNRKGDHNVSGVYRFINAIYRNQIYNYGKRLMYEFVIPQPSKFHTLWLNNSKTETINTLEKPVDPRKCGLSDFSVLNELNYMDWAARYNAEVVVKPDSEITVSHSYSKENTDKWASEAHGKAEIPEKYVGISYKAHLTTTKTGADSDGNAHNATLINIGGDFYPNYPIPPYHENAIKHYEFTKNNLSLKNSLEYAFSSWRIKVYAFSVEIKCKLTPEAYQQWQIETFNAIMNGYQNQLEEYNSKLSDIKNENEARLETNPLYYRQIEQTVLQKNCISYLSTSNNVDYIGKQMYAGNKPGNYRINISEDLDKYGSFAKFMEQAFEWDMMSYTFYPFYWGNKEEWSELYQFDCNDPLFKSFMQAGLARVVVTIKPGFEDAIMHYMETGQIWKGGEIPVIGDPLYLSIVDELKEQEYMVGETWETVVPTSLIALQNSGVAIEASGLPCFHKDEGMGSITDNRKKIGDSDTSNNETEAELSKENF